jgi:hypothetical protein
LAVKHGVNWTGIARAPIRAKHLLQASEAGRSYGHGSEKISTTKFAHNYSSFRSGPPNIDTDAKENDHKCAPDEDDVFHAHVANDREVILHIGITIEELVSLAKDEDSNRGEPDHCDRKCRSEWGKTGGFNSSKQRSELSNG